MRQWLVIICHLFLFSYTLLSYGSATRFSAEQQKRVQHFINMMVKKHHLNRTALNTVFKEVRVRPQVMRHINKPLEKEPWLTYQRLFVNERRIKNGVTFWRKWEATLKRAEKVYGVPASIIVATLGVETKYGERTGDYRVIDSLSSIAFSDSKRAPFFLYELEQFLLLTKEQGFDPLGMKGSYAGAMGQGQFMPSSYRRYAVKFSKGKKIDLMDNEADVIGSIANYYHEKGWKKEMPVAVRINKLSKRYEKLVVEKNINEPLRLAELKRKGIELKRTFQNKRLTGKIIFLPSESRKEFWFGFENFYVIKRYNPSDLYAMAVFQLSQDIRELKERLHEA